MSFFTIFAFGWIFIKFFLDIYHLILLNKLTPCLKKIYEKRKETIERVCAAMNLKKYAIHWFDSSLHSLRFLLLFSFLHYFTPFSQRKWGFATS